jgi:heat shock protein HtpX
MRRITLFLITNLAVLALLALILNVLGLDTLLARQGVNAGALLALAACVGFGGSLVSLALSKRSAKRLMSVEIIEVPVTPAQRWLVETVAAHAEHAGIAMPEVGIFASAEMNAFATGARRDQALLAVSSGLLQGMTSDEAEAVLGHEITHIANGDMVTLSLLQGVVNTFVIFLARVFGAVLDNTLGGSRDGERRGPGPFYFLIVIVLQVLFGAFANLVVMWFSRQREFRADAGGARLAGIGNMIAALERLEEQHEPPLPAQFAALGICGKSAQGLSRLFMSHPPIAERIATLRVAELRLV